MYYKIFCSLSEYNIPLYIYFSDTALHDGYIHDSYLQDGYIYTQLPKIVNYKTHYIGRFLLVLHLHSPRVPYVNSIFLLSPRVPACSISNLITGNGYIIQRFNLVRQSGLIHFKITVGEFRGNRYIS